MAVLDTADWPVDTVATCLDGEVAGARGHVFELASVTKLLTSRAVLVAVEEEALEPSDWGLVTELLSHAHGVGFGSRQQEKPPRTRRIYSSAGYEMAAELVEARTGIAFPEYLRQAVLEPLGMTHTVLYGSAGHGARSTIEDMALFAQELCFPTLLADSHYEVWFPMLRGVVPGYGSFDPCPWALGPEVKGEKAHWMGSSLPPHTIGHFGQAGTFVWVVPGEHYCVALTDRAFGPWAKPLWHDANTAVGEQLGYPR